MCIRDRYNTQATRELRTLFNEKEYFDFPKPIDLIKIAIEQGTTITDNDVVLDFFSGSATTANAVMQLNKEDGGNRKFICVQLPELCDEKSEAYKSGYKNICEIGKERIRRSGAKLTETTEQMQIGVEDKALDIGFKVYKLDTSNLVQWDNTPIPDHDLCTFHERLNGMVESIKPDRTDMDVVYEVMLKMGITLDTPVTYIEIGEKIAYVVGEFLLLICLANGIIANNITEMAEFAPAKIICAEQSFKDDTAMSNAHYILKDKGIELKLV